LLPPQSINATVVVLVFLMIMSILKLFFLSLVSWLGVHVNIQKTIALLVVLCSTGAGSLKPMQVTDSLNLQIGLLVQGLAAIGTTAAQISANKVATETTVAGRQKYNHLKLLARVGKTVTDASMLHNAFFLDATDLIGRVTIPAQAMQLVLSDLVNLGRDIDRIATFNYTPLSADELEAASVALQATGHSAEVALNICASLELTCNLAFIAHAAFRSGVRLNHTIGSAALRRHEAVTRAVEQLLILNTLFLTRTVPHIVDAHIKKNLMKKVLWSLALGLKISHEIALIAVTAFMHTARPLQQHHNAPTAGPHNAPTAFPLPANAYCSAVPVNDNCPICLNSLADAQLADIGRLRVCNHSFHRACVGAWFQNGNETCPMCRANAFQ
jgi:hypothetical protein